MRDPMRKYEANYEESVLGQKPVLSYQATASAATGTTYDGSYAIELTMAADVLSGIGLQVNDTIQLQTGAAAGQQLTVLHLASSTQVIASYASEFNNAGLPEITSITTVADASGSLASTYFDIYSGGNQTAYYVWYKVSGTGTNPSLGGKTGVEVDLVTNDTAATVATKTATALLALAGTPFTVSQSSNVLTVTTTTSGVTTATTDAGATGFTIAVVQAGTTPSETDVVFLAFLSTQPYSYY